MNLIINPNPKKSAQSVGSTLARRLADHFSGETRVIRIYEFNQQYFNYKFNQEWIDLVLAAKRLVLPVPMWNFCIPAALKDFFDKIAKQGVLWDLDKNNKYKGLLKNKTAYIIMTSGDQYPPNADCDFVIPYLRTFLTFIGVSEVKDFSVGGVTKSTELAADRSYLNQKTKEMLKAFGLLKNKDTLDG